MRTTLSLLLLLPLLLACERIPIVEVRVQGEGLDALYEEDNDSYDYWAASDDWYGLLVVARAEPERLRLFVRSYDESSAERPDVWWSEGARPMTVEAVADCEYNVRYFDNPGNSFANNYLKYYAPEIFPHSPEIEKPGLAAILEVQDCIGGSVGVSISVLDALGEPARQHGLTVQIEQVDWYYNPLLFQ